ncbi:MAG: hypothetical protein ABW252_00685 [Polyangiales bacterium]
MHLLVCVLATVLALAAGCDQCGGAPRGATIATLTTIAGPSAKRDWADKLHQWAPAAVGAELALGDGVQTDATTTAELTFINGARLALDAASTVRLLAERGAGDTALDIETGSARLRVGGRGLALRTHVGIATIAPDSEVVLTREGEALGFEVALGDVSFRDPDAGLIELRAGDSINIGIGMAVLEVRRNPRPAGEDEPPARSNEPFALEVTRGGVRVSGPDGKPRMLGRGNHALVPGAQLKLPAGSEAVLTRGGERVRLRGVGEFVLGEGGTLVEVRRGTAVMEADGPDLRIGVPEGTLEAHGDAEGTVATVTVGPTDGKLSVAQGRVTASLAGQSGDVTAGSERTWSHGAALAVTPGPSYRNLLARAGESFVVHAPEAPVAIGFDIGKCPGEGVLELMGARQQARGTGSANLLFSPGIRGYTLRCIGPRGPGNIVARGSVHVLVDPGTRKLPPRAPTSQVDADGRSYTIYYQNQLPEVAVRWPNAPVQKEYKLDLDGTPVSLTAPEHLFTSGSLRDGTHTLSFQAQGRRSRTTTVIVRFDNAAPKASLGSPPNRAFQAGDLVTVEGVALPGWRVSVQGGTVQSGAADRFSGQVQTSEEQRDIAVRLSHPRLGTHYYLRRATDSR